MDELSRNDQTTNRVKGVLEAVEIVLLSGLTGQEDNLDGTKGTPPSNTVPNNCNSDYFKPLRWGVDSLYLSYPGQLSEVVDKELRSLKTLAQERKDLAAKAQYSLDGHIFEVKDKSSGLFPFTIEDNSFQIRLSASHAKALPMAYVKVSSHYLAYKTPPDAESHLRSLLYPLGEISPPNVSRIDLFVDFASNEDMESWTRSAWVTKASGLSQFVEHQTFTGWSIGAGGVVMARLYNKRIEIQKSNKLYLEPLWREAGWDGESNVWRLEFQLKSELLKQLGFTSLPGIEGNLNGIWRYLMTDWLKLTIPSQTDKTRSRWPVHPLWNLLAATDWKTQGGPLLRTYSPSRVPSEESVARRALTSLASIGALRGLSNFDDAVDALEDAMYKCLDGQAFDLGITHNALFQEKVEILQRKYNTRLNPPLPEVEDKTFAKEYRRQTQGY